MTASHWDPSRGEWVNDAAAATWRAATIAAQIGCCLLAALAVVVIVVTAWQVTS